MGTQLRLEPLYVGRGGVVVDAGAVHLQTPPGGCDCELGQTDQLVPQRRGTSARAHVGESGPRECRDEQVVQGAHPGQGHETQTAAGPQTRACLVGAVP